MASFTTELELAVRKLFDRAIDDPSDEEIAEEYWGGDGRLVLPEMVRAVRKQLQNVKKRLDATLPVILLTRHYYDRYRREKRKGGRKLEPSEAQECICDNKPYRGIYVITEQDDCLLSAYAQLKGVRSAGGVVNLSKMLEREKDANRLSPENEEIIIKKLGTPLEKAIQEIRRKQIEDKRKQIEHKEKDEDVESAEAG